jgi:CspA family cold shock protein
MDLTNNTSTNTTTESTVDTNVLGCVKWFNPKVGYGFITNLDKGGDVFAHHSNIKSETNNFRYLVQGEYVQFNISYVSDDNRSVNAIDITGVRGGRLLCDVHSSQQMYTSSINGGDPLHRSRNTRDIHTNEESSESFPKPTNRRGGHGDVSHYPSRQTREHVDEPRSRPNSYRLPRSEIGKYHSA